MASRALPIQHLNVNVSTGASNVLVAGTSGYDLVLLSFILVAAGAVSATFEDEDGTDQVGLMSLAANGVITAPHNEKGWARLPSGKGLNLLLSAGVQVGGSLTYRLVPAHFEY